MVRAWGVAKSFLGRMRVTVPGGAMALGATGCLPLRKMGSRDAADVPDLGEDASAGLVHGGGDGLPELGLLGGPDAGDLRVADAHGRDGGALGDDEAGGGALAVVLDHDGRGEVVGGAAQARERRHDDAVGEVEGTDLQGFKQDRHADWMKAVEGRFRAGLCGACVGRSEIRSFRVRIRPE